MAGGVWSLIKLLSLLIEGIKSSLEALKNNSSNEDIPLEEQDMPINYVGIAFLIALLGASFFTLCRNC